MHAHGHGGRTGRAAGAAAASKLQKASPASTMFSAAAGELDRLGAAVRSRRCTTRRSRATCAIVAAVVAAAVIVLTAGSWGWGWHDWILDFDDEHGWEADIPLSNLTADHLLDGLLTAEFSYRSCRSRYEFAGYHKNSSHKPSPYLIAKIRKQEALQRRCGPGTASYKKALRRLNSGDGGSGAADDDCRYLVDISFRGLGNRMLAIASAFLYAVLTERVLLVDGGKDVVNLFCEPFPGTTWKLPPAGRRSPLSHLDNYDKESKESLGNMLQSGATVVSADGNVSWSSPPRPPPYVYLHLSGGYSFHDKLFYCGTHQKLLRDVPWLLMRTDSYLVPGLFLTPLFLGELETMFPEKDAAFYHLGRYLFHPRNAVWHDIIRYYRSNLAGAGRRVGIQIRVFHENHPPQQVLDQVLSCVCEQNLLPEITTAANGTTPSDAVLVTSLSSWYSERLRDEYGHRIAGGVHQPSNEMTQRSGNAAHDMQALSEIYLLSMCDVLVTSGFSTFGYVAQGLGGVQPWIMWRPSPFDAMPKGGLQAAPEPPCQRALSVEPCFHSPSYYDCAAGRDVELDRVTPYIRRCEDVDWGIKIVNGSRNYW